MPNETEILPFATTAETVVEIRARDEEKKDTPSKPNVPGLGRWDLHRRILRYLRPYRGAFITALLCMVFFGATDGAVPFLVKEVLDGVFARQDRTLLTIVPIILIIFAILRALCDFGQQFLMSRIGHLIVRDLRNEINAHLLTLSSDFYLVNPTGNLLSRVTSDVLLLRTLLTESVAAVIRDSIRVVALVVAAVALDPFLALIACAAFPFGGYPIYRFGRRLRKLSKKGQEEIGGLTALLQETILGHRVVKIFGREEYERERFREENERLNSTFVKSEMIRAISGPVNEVLASLAISGVILYGGYSVINGSRSQGDFIAFLISVFLLYDPFKRLTRVSGAVQQGLAGADRIFEVLDSVPSIQQPSVTVPLGSGNDIEFKDVSFSYSTSASPVLQDISLRINEGMKVALVGFSGAGKTTLVDLIPRFIDVTGGQVTVGGVDLRRVSLVELRRRIAMVGQHTFLFNDTVRNNIGYGNPAATSSEIEEAARAAFAFDFISQLPKGFDTVVGEAGLSLSGGERQRIAIARALLKDAPILILDEATASLDNRSEREVQAALERLERNRTCVVIAHRLSTVMNADLIVVMKEGRIVETGTHDALLQRAGEYAALYALQFRDRPQGEVGGRV